MNSANKPYFRCIKQFISRIIACFLLLISVTDIKAQDPAFYKLGEKEFANTDIYTLLYDENTDILYVGTNNGLYTYSHNEFKAFRELDNQLGNSFFRLRQNSLGEVFCCNLNGQIFKIDGNHIILHYQHLNSPEDKFVNYEVNYKDELLIASMQSLVVMNLANEIAVIYNCEKPLIITDGEFRDTISRINVCNSFGEDVFLSANSSSATHTIRLDKNYICSNSITNRVVELVVNSFIQQKNRFYAVNMDGNIDSSIDFSENQLIVDFEKQQKERLLSINDSIVIGLNSQKGMRYHYLNGDTLTVSKLFFKNEFISTCTYLESGALLFGTFGGGIKVVENPDFSKSIYENLFLGISTSPDNEVRVSTRSGQFYKVGPNDLELLESTPQNIDNVFYVPENEMLRILGYGDFIYNDTRRFYGGIIDLIGVGDDMIALGTANAIELFSISPNHPSDFVYRDPGYYYYNIILDRVRSLVWEERDSVIYSSTNSGLIKVDWHSLTKESILVNEEKIIINDLSLNNHLLICGTQKDGVIILQDELPIFQLTQKDGLGSNQVIQVEQKDSILYIITKMGMQIYDRSQSKFLSFGTREGVQAEKIRKFALSDDKLWLLEKHSYYSLNIEDIKGYVEDKSISKLYFDSVVVNNQLINHFDVDEFSYNENAFIFHFDYRNLESKKETQILYTLDGFYDHWKTINTSENEIEFQSLPVGKYTFKMKAQYDTQETETFIYSFEIFPPFWQTWWFYSLVLLALLLIVAIYVRTRIAKVKKEELVKLEKQKMLTETIDSKLKALRSQMNPHFIFNSLNSIQALILRQDTQKSYDYVVMFAELVRKTLHYSEEDFINVEDELEFLETYLKLESLRMKEEFSFDIKYNGDRNVKIPSLMIQPFVENAIHHGLLHKEGEKRITIHFKLDAEMTCIITDNGIGREKAREIKSRQNSSHKSFSLEATKQRIKIIEEQTDKCFGYEIIDLNPEGTKVIVKIPFKHQF